MNNFVMKVDFDKGGILELITDMDRIRLIKNEEIEVLDMSWHNFKYFRRMINQLYDHLEGK